ncbi:hypothetical protein D3C76_1411690 [compost metagenome]
MANLPATFLMANQAAVHLVFHSQPGQLIRGNRIDKVAKTTLDNYRALLPIALQKVVPVEI